MKKLCSFLVWTLCFSLMSGHALAQDAKMQQKEPTAQEKKKQMSEDSSPIVQDDKAQKKDPTAEKKKKQVADESLPVAKDGDRSAIKVKSSFNLFNSKGVSLFYVGEDGKIGLGTIAPTDRLTVDGFIHLRNGGIKFPDGSILSSAIGGGGGSMGPAGAAWKLGGNDNIDNSNFLGTTNSAHLLFKTNDIERMRIRANGNVGIGTSTPNQRLDVEGTARMTGFMMPTSATNGSVLTSNATGTGTWQTLNANSVGAWSLTGSAGTNHSVNFLGTTDDKDLVMKTNGLERIRVLRTGRVGIGNSSPDGILDVRGPEGQYLTLYDLDDGPSGRFARLTAGSGASHGGEAGVRAGHATGSGGHGGEARLEAGNAYVAGGVGGDVAITSGYSPSGTAGNIVMTTGTGATNGSFQFVNGNVGIGTTTPSTKLDVVGGIAANFIGTTNDEDFVIKTNGVEKIRVSRFNPARVGINNNSPDGPFDVRGRTGQYLTLFDSIGGVGGFARISAGTGNVQGGEAGVRAGHATGSGGHGGEARLEAGNAYVPWGVGGDVAITSGYSPSGTAGNIVMTTGTGATNGSFQFVNGNVGIGTPSPTNVLTVQQNSSTDPIADAWTTYSSRRWKTNIKTIERALEKVERLHGVTYDWKADGKHDIGLIAEEVGEVIPEIVKYEDNGVDARSVDYPRLVAVLIEAVKEQQQLIETQKAEVAAARSEVGDMKAKMTRLETTMQRLEALMSARENSGTPSSESISQRNN